MGLGKQESEIYYDKGGKVTGFFICNKDGTLVTAMGRCNRGYDMGIATAATDRENNLQIDPNLSRFAESFDYTTKSNDRVLEYRVAQTMKDWKTVTDFAPDSRLNEEGIPRYRGREGIHAKEKNKPAEQQKMSLTALIGSNKDNGDTLMTGIILYYPPELKKTLRLFKVEGDYLRPITYYDINPDNRDMFFLGFIQTNAEYRANLFLSNFKAYLKWIKTFIEVYNPDADVMGIAQGNFEFAHYRDINHPVYIPNLDGNIQAKIGKPRQESEASDKFCRLIGMQKIQGLVSRADLGPVYHGEVSDLRLER